MKATILVVTNRTAASEDLLAALQARAGRGPRPASQRVSFAYSSPTTRAASFGVPS